MFRWAEAGEEAGVFCDLSQDGAQGSTWKPSPFSLRRLSDRSSKVHLKSSCDLDTVVAAALHEVGFLHGRMAHAPVSSRSFTEEAGSHRRAGPLIIFMLKARAAWQSVRTVLSSETS